MRVLIAILAAVLAGGCFWGGETNANTGESVNQPVNGNTQTAPVNAAPDDDSSIQMEEIYPVESYSSKTPTEAMRTYIMATVNKDVPAVKKSLSKDSLKMIEESAREQNTTVGQLLTRGAVENESKKIPDLKNEKIEGETATVEYKDETMTEFVTMYLVKEDGEWKIALDKFMEELIKKATEAMNQPTRPGNQ